MSNINCMYYMVRFRIRVFGLGLLACNYAFCFVIIIVSTCNKCHHYCFVKLARKLGFLLVHFVYVNEGLLPAAGHLGFMDKLSCWKDLPLFEAEILILHWRECSGRFRNYIFFRFYLRYFCLSEESVLLSSLLFSREERFNYLGRGRLDHYSRYS